MKFNFFFIPFLLLLSRQVYSQTDQFSELPIPQLKAKLSAAKQDTDRIQIMLALGRATLFKSGSGAKEIDTAMILAARTSKMSNDLHYSDGITNSLLLSAVVLNKQDKKDKGLEKAKQALANAQKDHSSRGAGEAYIMIGQHYSIEGQEINTRLDYYNKAAAAFKSGNYLLRYGNTLKDIGDLLQYEGKRIEAVKNLFESLKVLKSIGYPRLQGVYWLLGTCTAELGDYPSSIKYDLLAINTAQQQNDTTLQLCSIYYSTARSFFLLKNHDSAIDYAKRALAIAAKYNSTDNMGTVAMGLVYYYTESGRFAQALALDKKLDEMPGLNSVYDKMRIQLNFLNIYLKMHDWKKAGLAADMEFKLSKDLKADDDMIIVIYPTLSKYYLATKQYEKSRHYLDLYSKAMNLSKALPGMLTAEKIYFSLDSTMGNYIAAIGHTEKVQYLKDSLYSVTRSHQIALMQTENETEQKENNIRLLTKQAQLKDSVIKRGVLVQKIIAGSVIVILIISGLIYYSYRSKKRSNLLLEKQKAEIDKQNVVLQQLVGDKDNLISEKDLLLKEVHHRVKNNLQMVMSLLESQTAFLQNSDALDAIAESQNRVQAIALIHQKLYASGNTTAVDIAEYIPELISWLNDSFKANNFTIRHHVEALQLDVAQAMPLGIILNEAITNAVKYAFPTNRRGEIIITVKRRETQLLVDIADNGVGLPDSFEVTGAKSLGITLMKGLTVQLHGIFSIEGKGGVTINISFPIETIGSLAS